MARGVPNFDGSALRVARKWTKCPYHDHALTADCLARMVGTSKALILSYEHGRSNPSPQRLRELSEAVGQPASALQTGETHVSNLRVAQGLTTGKLASQLGLAVNTYRRIESKGLMPKRRPGVIWDLAQELQVDYTQLRTALARIPAVQQRRRIAADLLAPAVERARMPGRFKQVQDTSTEALQLSEIFEGRPAAISKLINLQLGDLRQLLAQRDQARARRDFTTTVTRKMLQMYEDDVERLNEEIRAAEARIPDLLEQYLVHPLSQQCWTTFAKLYTAGPSGLDNLSPNDETVVALGKVFDSYLIEHTLTVVRLSAQGTLFFADTLPYYRALYSSEDRALRPDMQHYGWPRIAPDTQQRRHLLRTAHIMAYDPYPHWRGGERMVRLSQAR